MAEVSVLLGICDEPITDRSSVDFTVSKIGGSPDVPIQLTRPACRLCKRPLLHVVQLYCPLSGSSYHRTISIYACASKACKNKRESWRVIRFQILDSTSQCKPCKSAEVDDGWGVDYDNWDDDSSEQNNHNKEGSIEWCDGADDWGDEDDVEDNIDNPPVETLQTKDSQDPLESVTEKQPEASTSGLSTSTDMPLLSSDDDMASDQPMDYSQLFKSSSEIAQPSAIDQDLSEKVRQLEMNNEKHLNDADPDLAADRDAIVDEFIPHYLNVYEEPSTPESRSLKYEKKLLREYSRREGVDVEVMADEMNISAGGAGEKYEKSLTKHGDRAFHKFMKRISLCPQQCIRYSRQGQPLLMQATAHFRPASCPHCGSQRVFEFQLMPALVHFLKVEIETEMRLEFGTVIIFTCEKSCWQDAESDTYREEEVLLQSDPDEHLFK